jgi:hypothetical protein
MKLFWGILILALVAATGCVTKSKADAEAKAAYIAGQKAAYQSMGQTMMDVIVLGDVSKHEIPFVAGLTLSQALTTADYTGAHDPVEIVVRRNSVETRVDPKQLLAGQDMQLQPGDIVNVVGQ